MARARRMRSSSSIGDGGSTSILSITALTPGVFSTIARAEASDGQSSTLPSNNDPVLQTQVQAIERNAMANAVVTQLIRELLLQFGIRHVGADLNQIAQTLDMIDAFDFALQVGFIDQYWYGPLQGNDPVFRSRANVLPLILFLKFLAHVLLNLLVILATAATPLLCRNRGQDQR